MIDLSVLDDSTIWVAISFFIFLVLIFKPIKSQISNGLDQKINELKSQITEAENLKKEAEDLLMLQQKKLSENDEKIEKLKKETAYQVLQINESVDKEFKISSERRSKAFKTGLKQIEEKIKNDLKRDILQKTVIFTELRIKKELKKKHNSSFIEESLKKLSDHI
jgi:F-type H+-transporting ATPase subunit b